MIEKFCSQREVVLYCDMHGCVSFSLHSCVSPSASALRAHHLHSHSRKKNTFLYGCENASSFTGHEKIFPMLFERSSVAFSLPDCDFRILKSKESTGRVVVRRTFDIINSYTLETSMYGSHKVRVYDLDCVERGQ